VLAEKPFSLDLRSQRLKLKLARVGQTRAFWQAIKQDQLLGGSSWMQIQSFEQAKSYIRKRSLRNPGPELCYFSYNKKNELIGSLHVHTLSYSDHRLELGYWVRKQFEGLGYASEALKSLEKEIQKLGFHRIEIRCHPRNSRSIRLAKRNQYVYEGTHKQDTRVEGGFLDTVIYAKIIGSDEAYTLA